ncbi:MAG TPA: hypothetical protein QF556_05945, partial [Rhodospirillales bacterium]|nr:hypothetical protein [Rhodospirillales bacterium]
LRVAFPALPGRRERLTMYPHRRRVRSYRESGKSDRMGSGIPPGCTSHLGGRPLAPSLPAATAKFLDNL